MKKTFFVVTALACLMQASAQTPEAALQKKMQTSRALAGRLLQAQTPASHGAQKPTGIAHRVLAETVYTPDAERDSAAFKYSGNRGSRFNHDDPYYRYNAHFDGAQAPIPIIPYGPDPLNQFFDIDPADLQADSIKYYSGATLSNIGTATYTTGNKVLRSRSSEPGIPQVNARVNVYNTAGRLSAAYTLESTDNGANFDTVSVRRWTYNAAGTQVASDSAFIKTPSGFQLSGVLQYGYNAGGKPDSILVVSSIAGPPAVSQKLLFTYYSDGKLRQIQNTESSIPGMRYISTDSFGYTTGAAYITFWQSKIKMEMPTDTMAIGTRTFKYPGAGGLPDSAHVFNYNPTTNSWAAAEKVRYTYTSFHDPETIVFSEDGALKATLRFYYENYENGTSIKPLVSDKDLKVYPNPFTDRITLQWKEQTTGVTLQLTDLGGREVYRSALQLHTGENTLPMPALSPGNYLLLIRDKPGAVWRCKLLKR